MNKAIRILLMIFFGAVLAFSAWQLWGMLGSYREGRSSYDDLEKYVSFSATAVPETAPPAQETEAPAAESTPGPDISAWPQVDFSRLSQINPDIVGWICIEGTNINYPVVQGSDNDYYLNHLFDGTYNSSGCIFLDAGCYPDFSGLNSVVYGHHMKDKSMFSGLMSYKDQTFYDEHSQALLVTPDAYYRISFFSGYVSDTRASAWELSFSEYEFVSWLGDIQRKSCFESDFSPTKDDRIVTLSTCTYEFDSAKFVLHGFISEVIEKSPAASG